ncbi:DUF3592 domain-containing protein [uncultured Litoreibacter sp.]|uniref:DUF3592 domain-containing protein n=1 Tax=uncultured Litoreibacter sp. TaxID=1392394 RepID=UPI0026338C21|nr:DUF3592 domain-containing protein [uncultured Litoreibacter sp.]
MTKATARPPKSWLTICGFLVVGVLLIFVGNVDRIIWNMSRDGAQVSGRVVEMRSIRNSPSDNFLTFLPRVEFTDPGGQERVMSVKRGSQRYDFRKGDRVTVLWRADSQTIAIDLPLKRHVAVSIGLWLLTFVGAALLLAFFVFSVGRIWSWRRKRDSNY